jgi:hypothetical protein
MRSLHTALVLSVLLPALSGCGVYDPPVQGDHATEKYQTDLKACRESSTESVRLKNARTLWSWVISPYTGPPEVRAAIRACMQGKGYMLGQAEG